MPDEFGQHKEKYPDVPFIEHVALMVRAVQVEAEIRHQAYVERYESEQVLKDKALEKAEKANDTHFGLINGLQHRQDEQQREHAQDLIRVRGEMASAEALRSLEKNIDEKYATLEKWRIAQETAQLGLAKELDAKQNDRDRAFNRRMALMGLALGVFSVLTGALMGLILR